MSKVVDNLVAYRVLSMLVKPFVETDAYRLGIIDNKGKNLIKSSDFKTEAQREAYTYLHRLVFNMKKIINKLPGGESKLKSVVSAFFLVKEYYESNSRSTSLMEERFRALMEFDGILAEETILVEKYMKDLEEDGEGGAAPANVTGAMVSTDIPVPKKKDLKKYKQNQEGLGGSGLINLNRRPEPKL
jgi:hypothetical protein